MTIIFKSALLLTFSNLFMTFAWYAHLKNLGSKPWYLAALTSWVIALLEYLIQVPANLIGYTVMNLRPGFVCWGRSISSLSNKGQRRTLSLPGAIFLCFKTNRQKIIYFTSVKM